jgi:hypothetical protein
LAIFSFTHSKSVGTFYSNYYPDHLNRIYSVFVFLDSEATVMSVIDSNEVEQPLHLTAASDSAPSRAGHGPSIATLSSPDDADKMDALLLQTFRIVAEIRAIRESLHVSMKKVCTISYC